MRRNRPSPRFESSPPRAQRSITHLPDCALWSFNSACNHLLLFAQLRFGSQPGAHLARDRLWRHREFDFSFEFEGENPTGNDVKCQQAVWTSMFLKYLVSVIYQVVNSHSGGWCAIVLADFCFRCNLNVYGKRESINFVPLLLQAACVELLLRARRWQRHSTWYCCVIQSQFTLRRSLSGFIFTWTFAKV